LRLKILLPAFLVPVLVAGAVLTGVMPVAGSAILQDAQDALSGAIDQVGDKVSGTVDQIQDEPVDEPPTEPDPVIVPVPDAESGGSGAVAEVGTPLLDIPGYLHGTANGVALLQTTRVDSPTHQGWVEITLDLVLMSLIPEETINPSISLNGNSTLACFPASSGFQDCLGIEWGTEEQFMATLQPHPLPSEVWPKAKGRPWSVVFEIPDNAQIASLVYGRDRIPLNLGGDQISNSSPDVPTESYRPRGRPDAPAGSNGYFLGENYGMAVTDITCRPHATEPTWSIIDLGIDVMSFADVETQDIPIQIEAEDGEVCYVFAEERDCVEILWGGVNQFDPILTSERKSGSVPWPRSKGWPTVVSFVVPTSISGATLIFGRNAVHVDIRSELGDSIPCNYADHYKPLTGLTLYDQATQTIDLVAIERDAITADVLLIFEAVNRSENQDFFPGIKFEGSRVSPGGQVFDGLDAIAGWAPVKRTTLPAALAPGQRSEITVVMPRVEGPGFAAIPHSNDQPDAMLIRLYAASNPNGAEPPSSKRFEPFYVAFGKLAGGSDAQFFFPDLAITDLVLSPEDPTEGDTITATLGVTNQGPRNAQATVADLMVNGRYHASTKIPALAAHGSSTVTFTWTATLAPAILKAVLDPANLVQESSRTNNTAEVSFGGGALPDLTVVGVELIAPSAGNGPTPQFALTMRNQGTGSAKPYRVILTPASGGGFFVQFDTLKPGATETLIYPWIAALSTGPATLRVDAANDIQESDESNNTYIATLPDLTTTSNVGVEIAEDSTARASFEITNLGGMAATSAQVKIVVDGETSTAQILDIRALGIGDSVVVLSGTIPGDGRHQIDLHIDPLNSIPEGNNDNNTMVFTYTIGPLAELTVASVSLGPEPFAAGVEQTLEIMVANRGGRKSGITTADIYNPTLADLLGTVLIPAIEPGEQKMVSFVWTPETMLASVQVVLDPALAVDEENEDNNTSVLEIKP
jgi:subtilase family serine protease